MKITLMKQMLEDLIKLQGPISRVAINLRTKMALYDAEDNEIETIYSYGMSSGELLEFVNDVLKTHGEQCSFCVGSKDLVIPIYDEDDEQIGILYGFDRDEGTLVHYQIPSIGGDIKYMTKEYKLNNIPSHIYKLSKDVIKHINIPSSPLEYATILIPMGTKVLVKYGDANVDESDIILVPSGTEVTLKFGDISSSCKKIETTKILEVVANVDSLELI